MMTGVPEARLRQIIRDGGEAKMAAVEYKDFSTAAIWRDAVTMAEELLERRQQTKAPCAE